MLQKRTYEKVAICSSLPENSHTAYTDARKWIHCTSSRRLCIVYANTLTPAMEWLELSIKEADWSVWVLSLGAFYSNDINEWHSPSPNWFYLTCIIWMSVSAGMSSWKNLIHLVVKRCSHQMSPSLHEYILQTVLLCLESRVAEKAHCILDTWIIYREYSALSLSHSLFLPTNLSYFANFWWTFPVRLAYRESEQKQIDVVSNVDAYLCTVCVRVIIICIRLLSSEMVRSIIWKKLVNKSGNWARYEYIKYNTLRADHFKPFVCSQPHTHKWWHTNSVPFVLQTATKQINTMPANENVMRGVQK